MTGIRSLRCRTAHRWLAPAHDGELPVARQLALDAHLNACTECRRVRQELRAVSVALREYATEHRPNETDCARVASDVLEAMPAWPRRPLERRLREVVADGQRLCVVGGAAVSMLLAGLFVAMALSFSPPVHPHSLAGFLQGAGSLGSNANPLLGFETGVSLPHVSADTQAAAMLIRPLPPLVLEKLALSAVVTREGLLASVEVLRQHSVDARRDTAREGAPGAPERSGGAAQPDAELQRALSRLASDVRFVPAQAWGSPVAVNVVWLLERTTVLPRSPRTESRWTAPGVRSPRVHANQPA
jgi:hypothetical protein